MSSYFPKVTRAKALAAIVVLLVLAALYEALVALRVIPMGKMPGEGPFGGGVVLLVASLALLTGVAISLSGISSQDAGWKTVAPLVAPAAAAFVVARFFAFDDYYLPGLRRMSDGGWVPWQWIAVLTAFALLAAVVTKILPPPGIALTSFVLFTSALTSLAVGMGH